MGGGPDEGRGAAAARRLQLARHAFKSSARTTAIGPALLPFSPARERPPRREKLPYRSYQFRAPFSLGSF